MEQLVKLVGSYKERDKLLRFLQYLFKVIAGSGRTKWSHRLTVLSSEFGACRTVLRLFDDIPMLAYSLHYGLGGKEKNTWLRALELLSNVANQLFYPLEHVAWLASKKLVDRCPHRWGVACILAWAAALISEILKAIIRVRMIHRAQIKLKKETELESRDERESGEGPQTIRSQLRSLKSQEAECYLSIIEHGADLVNAIGWLPAGFLWSSQLSTRTLGLMGTVSSFIKLYKVHAVKSYAE